MKKQRQKRLGYTPRVWSALALAVLMVGVFSCRKSSKIKASGAADQSILIIKPEQLAIEVGESVELEATLALNAEILRDVTQEATWSVSGDGSVATLTKGEDGVVTLTAVAQGTATVSAAFEDYTDDQELTVNVPVDSPAGSITITPGAATLPLGAVQEFTAQMTDANGASRDVSDEAEWLVEGDQLEIVGDPASTVRVRGIALGDGAVKAKLDGLTGASTVSVTAASLTKVTVTASESVRKPGLLLPLLATGLYSDGSTRDLTADVLWRSNRADIVEVSSAADSAGLATMIKAGDADVSATLAEVSGGFTVSVVGTAPVALRLSVDDITIPVGLSRYVSAIATYSDGQAVDVTSSATWTSRRESRVTVGNVVGSRGVATAVAPGTSVITAAFADLTADITLVSTDAVLTSLTVEPTDASLPAGLTKAFRAFGHFSDGSTIDVSSASAWSSSSASATVSSGGASSGTAAAVAVGTATITASYGGQDGAGDLTVTPAILQALEISPNSLVLPRGYSGSLSANGEYSDGASIDITSFVNWSTNSVDAAYFSPFVKGRVVGVAVGTTAATAGFGDLIGAGNITVTDATLQSLTLSPAAPQIAVGQTSPLVATGNFSDTTTLDLTSAVTWTVADSAIATVSASAGSKGVLRGLQAGSTTVTGQLGQTSASIPIVVTAAPARALVAITVLPSSLSLTVGHSASLEATGTYDDGSHEPLTGATWDSSNPGIVGVGSDGAVEALGAGSSTISATVGSISGSCLVSAAVGPVVSLSYSGTSFPEAASNSGAISQSRTISLTNDSFSSGQFNEGDEYQVTSGAVPPGMTLSVTRNSGSSLTLLLTGNATDHSDADDTSFTFALKDSAFALGTVPTGAVQVFTVDFKDPVPSAPSIAAIANSASQITVSWSAITGANGGYKIAYQSGASAPANCSAGTTTTAAAGATSKAITGLAASTQFSFIACAVNVDSGDSAASASASATTNASATLTYSGLSFAEAGANDGTLATTRTVTLVNDTFTAGPFNETDEFSVAGVPTGLTFVVTRDSATQLTLSFTGSASAHANSDDTSGVTLTLNAAAFTSGVAPSNNNPKSLSIDFSDNGSGSATFISGAGTFTVPAGVTSLTIEVWGAGGGGGGGDEGTGNNGGGGGGGGGYTIKTNLVVTPGQMLSYTVGAGGAGGVGGGDNITGLGGTGGTSDVAATYIAAGGAGGQIGDEGPGGIGGTASGGDTNITGATGVTATSNTGGNGGDGGNGGAGGGGGITDVIGTAGTAPGGGGGGGGKRVDGGVGGSGRVKFSW